MSVSSEFFEYHTSVNDLMALDQVDAKRQQLLQTAKYYRYILLLNSSLKEKTKKFVSDIPDTQNGVSEIPEEKNNNLAKQLENSQKELEQLRNVFLTAKTSWESKLETTKSQLAKLKEKQVLLPTPSKLASTMIKSKVAPKMKILDKEKDNFSTSPFLKRIGLAKKSIATPNKTFMSPTVNSMNKTRIMANSTPSANATVFNTPSKSPSKSGLSVLSAKKSLFDLDDDETRKDGDDDDLFSNSFKKMDVSKIKSAKKSKNDTMTVQNETILGDNTINESKIETKRKRKLANFSSVNIDVEETALEDSTPIKKPKQNTTIDKFSPLKSSNRKNIFRI